MRAGIAFGSNVGDRLAQLRRARGELMTAPGVSGPVRASRVYETEPVGSSPDAGAFLNAVLEVEFEGQPITLLDELQEAEARMGRPSKRPRNAPRAIDLDLLYVGNLVLRNEEVMIPHPRLHLRRFVLEPLHEVAPALLLPGQQQTVAEMLTHLRDPAKVTLFTDGWEP